VIWCWGQADTEYYIRKRCWVGVQFSYHVILKVFVDHAGGLQHLYPALQEPRLIKQWTEFHMLAAWSVPIMIENKAHHRIDIDCCSNPSIFLAIVSTRNKKPTCLCLISKGPWMQSKRIKFHLSDSGDSERNTPPSFAGHGPPTSPPP